MAKERESGSSGVADRIYTIPLRKGWLNTRYHGRANRSVNDIKRFLIRHLKTDDVRISARLNELIWKRGNSKPPASVKVKVSVKGGIATARLPEEVVIEKKDKKPEPKSKIEELKQRAEDMKSGKKDEGKKETKEPITEKIREEVKESPVKKVREEMVSKSPTVEKPKKEESNSKQ